MNPEPRRCFLTTSWDDGHPSDLRIAEMLARNNIPGTFYIPADSERELMDARRVRELGEAFDLGAHTLHHVRLSRLPVAEAASEVAGSKDYLEQLTGKACSVFAPPGGRFGREHARVAEQAGFRGFRTTELMNLDPPRFHGYMAVMPTTLQLFRHRPIAYFKNAVRRGRPLNLGTYLRFGRGAGLADAFRSLLNHAIEQGGVMHLWGHSWEVDECGDWPVLAEILECVAERRHELRLVSNSALCDWALNDAHTTAPVSNAALP